MENTGMSHSPQHSVLEFLAMWFSSILLMIPGWIEGVEMVIKLVCLVLSGIASLMTIRKLRRKK